MWPLPCADIVHTAKPWAHGNCAVSSSEQFDITMISRLWFVLNIRKHLPTTAHYSKSRLCERAKGGEIIFYSLCLTLSLRCTIGIF